MNFELDAVATEQSFSSKKYITEPGKRPAALFLGTARESICRIKTSGGKTSERYDIPGENGSAAELRQYYERLSRFDYSFPMACRS